jgi:E3 ubiquitin-protein ligase CHFR
LAYDCLDFLETKENDDIKEKIDDKEDFVHSNKKIKLDLDVISKEKNDNLKLEDKKQEDSEEIIVENKPEKTERDINNNDKMIDSLNCSICSEIMHECISLQPCLHSYCSGCYSEWMEKSDECPICRKKVDRISKNHLINNLIQSYLKENPQYKRSEKDIKELEAKNKITQDMVI